MNFRNPSVLQTLLVLCLRTSFDPVVAAHAHKGLRKAQEHAEHSNPPDPISQSYPDLLYGNPYEGGCVDSPPGWNDSLGDNCDWYASSPDDCDEFDDHLYANEFGVTANMACCACGGGSTAPPTPGPTHAVPPPTPSPTYEDGGCVDTPGWNDFFGDNCDWYTPAPGDDCEFYGHLFANEDGVTANMACCACGGGSTAAPPTPGPTHAVPPPTPSPTYEDGGCVDSPSDWYDNIGDNCDWYASFPYNCDWYGKFPNKDGVTANMACCACGGGSTAA